MRGKKQNIVFLVVIVVLAAGGYLLHTMQMNSLRAKLSDRYKKAETELGKLREANEEARANAVEARNTIRAARMRAIFFMIVPPVFGLSVTRTLDALIIMA